MPLRGRLESEGWGPWSEKGSVHYAHAPAWALSRVVALRVSLDRLGPDNGPLRLIPGSHRCGVLTDQEVLRWARANPAQSCLTERGGVVAVRPLLIHSSSKARGGEPRRVLHIEYSDSLDLADGIRLAVV